MKSLVLGLVVATVPVAVSAQSGIDRLQNLQAMERAGQNIRMQGMEQQQDAWRESQNPRVVRRAEEAAKLINNGDCAGAMELARRANDRRLLAGVTRACPAASATAVTSASPAQVPAPTPAG